MIETGVLIARDDGLLDEPDAVSAGYVECIMLPKRTRQSVALDLQVLNECRDRDSSTLHGQHTNITLNSTFTTTPVMPSFNQNLLQRDVFDYDFNRERIFLEIAEAEIAAMHKAGMEGRVVTASGQDDLDDELSRQGAKLSLSSSMSSTRHQDSNVVRPRSTSEEDVAAAISASLREY